MSIPFDIPLDRDEAVLLASRGGGVRGYPIWIGLFVVFVVFSMCGMLGTGSLIMALVASGDALGDSEAPVAIFTLLFTQAPCFLASVFIIGLGAAIHFIPRGRPYYFFTTSHIVGRRVFGRVIRVPHGQIERMERFVSVTYGRYGSRREKTTDELSLTLRPGNIPRVLRIGPVAEADDFLSLFEEARSRENVELEQMARADGTSPPCELRSEFFVVQSTRSMGMSYGTLFIGPTTVMRFTEPLPMGVLARFYTQLAHAVDGEEAELRAKAIARHPSAGHTLVIDRASARPVLDGNTLTVRAGERSEPIELTPSDAERARKYLRSGP